MQFLGICLCVLLSLLFFLPLPNHVTPLSKDHYYNLRKYPPDARTPIIHSMSMTTCISPQSLVQSENTNSTIS